MRNPCNALVHSVVGCSLSETGVLDLAAGHSIAAGTSGSGDPR